MKLSAVSPPPKGADPERPPLPQYERTALRHHSDELIFKRWATVGIHIEVHRIEVSPGYRHQTLSRRRSDVFYQGLHITYTCSENKLLVDTDRGNRNDHGVIRAKEQRRYYALRFTSSKGKQSKGASPLSKVSHHPIIHVLVPPPTNVTSFVSICNGFEFTSERSRLKPNSRQVNFTANESTRALPQ